MEQVPLQMVFSSTGIIVHVIDVMGGNEIQNPTTASDGLPYQNRFVALAMEIYVTYVRMKEWIILHKPGMNLVENELTVFLPSLLFAAMQQHPKWESISWFQGSLFGTPMEMHRIPEECAHIYWGYRGDDMIIEIGKISCMNVSL